MAEEEKKIIKTTEFNMSSATLERIHENFKQANFYRVNKDYPGYHENLVSNYNEIDGYVKEMPEEIKKDLERIEKKVDVWMGDYLKFSAFMYDSLKKNQATTHNLIANARYNLVRSLLEYERVIRRIMIKKGLLLIEKQDAGEAVYEEE